MFFSSSRNGSVCDRWMQRGAMSSFTPSTVRKCTFVHDQTGTGARLEIARDAPPQFEQLSQKMGQSRGVLKLPRMIKVLQLSFEITSVI